MSTDVRRWTITNVDGFCQAVLDGPDTRPPENSGLVGMDWVDAARVDVVAVDDVRAAIAEVRGLAPHPATPHRSPHSVGWTDSLAVLRGRLGLEGDIERTGSDGDR